MALQKPPASSASQVAEITNIYHYAQSEQTQLTLGGLNEKPQFLQQNP